MQEYITIKWHVDDVRDLRPDLSPEQAWEVLITAKKHHDADIGINWEVLQLTADNMFEEKDEVWHA